MSGEGLRGRALAAAVFGTAGGLSLWITLGLMNWFFSLGSEPDTAGGGSGGVDTLWLSLTLVAVLPAAVAGWLRGEAFGTPALPDRMDWERSWHPDVLRGWGVTVRAYVAGCALFVAWPDAHDVSALRVGDWAAVVLRLIGDFVTVGLFGAVFVGPFALMMGGTAGWLVGRAAGTAAPPAR